MQDKENNKICTKIDFKRGFLGDESIMARLLNLPEGFKDGCEVGRLLGDFEGWIDGALIG
jgi:hypothetical protein